MTTSYNQLGNRNERPRLAMKQNWGTNAHTHGRFVIVVIFMINPLLCLGVNAPILHMCAVQTQRALGQVSKNRMFGNATALQKSMARGSGISTHSLTSHTYIFFTQSSYVSQHCPALSCSEPPSLTLSTPDICIFNHHSNELVLTGFELKHVAVNM